MLPDRVTEAVLAQEFKAALQWAERQQIKVTCDLPQRRVRAVYSRQGSGEKFYLQGLGDGYREIPPAWQWCRSDWSEPGDRCHSPEPKATPHGSSMFLDDGTTAIICAPFNRLAHQVQGGPHGDWGDLVHWTTAGQGHVYAVEIADMLHVIARDFRYTTGRMA